MRAPPFPFCSLFASKRRRSRLFPTQSSLGPSVPQLFEEKPPFFRFSVGLINLFPAFMLLLGFEILLEAQDSSSPPPIALDSSPQPPIVAIGFSEPSLPYPCNRRRRNFPNPPAERLPYRFFPCVRSASSSTKSDGIP